MLKRRLFAVVSILILGSLLGCQKPTTVLGDADERAEETPRDFISQMAEAIAKRPDVMGLDSLPKGKYLLLQIDSSSFFRHSNSEFTAHYSQLLKLPGTLSGSTKKDGTPREKAEQDTCKVWETDLPPAMGYYVTLPLSLPLEFDGVAKSFTKKVMFELNYSRGATATDNTYSWSSHSDPSRGYNLFGAFRKNLEKTKGKAKYYAASLDNFQSGKGFVAWIEKSALAASLPPGFELYSFIVMYPNASEQGFHKLELMFFRLP